MSDGTFEKVSRSDRVLYGPRRLILCGFAAGMQANFAKVLELAGLTDLGRVWATENQAEDTLEQLMEYPDGTGTDTDSTLPRAIVVAGIRENDLHTLMNTCRASGMKAALWAVLTPVSAKWTLRQLISELEAERTALAKRS